MTNSQRLEIVRSTLTTWYENRHQTSFDHFNESILIRDGFYCGRKFRFADYSAVWFAEEDQLKLYDPQGALLESFVIDGTPITNTPITNTPMTSAPLTGTPLSSPRRAAA